MAQAKTNAMRMLERQKIAYTPHEYDTADGGISGAEVARKTGQDPHQVFKTLVARGHSGQVLVFVVPVCAELDLKKAARAAGEKSVAMVRQQELLGLTGYVHGGCSPVGMKKAYPTFVDGSARPLERMLVSGGRIGCQVELSPGDLLRAAGASWADLAACQGSF